MSTKSKFILEYEVDYSKTEGTCKPIWYIVVISGQRLVKKEDYCHEIMSRIVGPFSSRERAASHRRSRLYQYGESSVVFCHSGYYSDIKEVNHE